MEHRLMDIVKETGVSDLPMKIKAKFAQAIKAEREGDNARAEEKLREAVAFEG